jgi:hypothetical protein
MQRGKQRVLIALLTRIGVTDWQSYFPKTQARPSKLGPYQNIDERACGSVARGHGGFASARSW